MLSFPHAKINLGLYITAKRADGFHNLESCFYPVDWSDILEIIPSQTTSLIVSGLPVDSNSDENLCIKAYKLLAKDYELPPASIFLHKVIPMGAGLGGVSSDAASTITMLNRIHNLGLNISQMQDYARLLGSDCAFFVEGKPQYCYEKGDKFSDIQLSLKGKYIVLVYPNIHISTKEAYAGVKPAPLNFNLKVFLENTPLRNWKNTLQNDFETHLFQAYPQLYELKSLLYDSGAVYASMSGSGSTVYGIFETKPQIISFPTDYTIWEGFLK